ncbi:MAG: hypothetical protein AAFZ92_02505, partial [Pseudomonadota bacterium]
MSYMAGELLKSNIAKTVLAATALGGGVLAGDPSGGDPSAPPAPALPGTELNPIPVPDDLLFTDVYNGLSVADALTVIDINSQLLSAYNTSPTSVVTVYQHFLALADDPNNPTVTHDLLARALKALPAGNIGAAIRTLVSLPPSIVGTITIPPNTDPVEVLMALALGSLQAGDNTLTLSLLTEGALSAAQAHDLLMYIAGIQHWDQGTALAPTTPESIPLSVTSAAKSMLAAIGAADDAGLAHLIDVALYGASYMNPIIDAMATLDADTTGAFLTEIMIRRPELTTVKYWLVHIDPTSAAELIAFIKQFAEDNPDLIDPSKITNLQRISKDLIRSGELTPAEALPLLISMEDGVDFVNSLNPTSAIRQAWDAMGAYAAALGDGTTLKLAYLRFMAKPDLSRSAFTGLSPEQRQAILLLLPPEPFKSALRRMTEAAREEVFGLALGPVKEDPFYITMPKLFILDPRYVDWLLSSLADESMLPKAWQALGTFAQADMDRDEAYTQLSENPAAIVTSETFSHLSAKGKTAMVFSLPPVLAGNALLSLQPEDLSAVLSLSPSLAIPALLGSNRQQVEDMMASLSADNPTQLSWQALIRYSDLHQSTDLSEAYQAFGDETETGAYSQAFTQLSHQQQQALLLSLLAVPDGDTGPGLYVEVMYGDKITGGYALGEAWLDALSSKEQISTLSDIYGRLQKRYPQHFMERMNSLVNSLDTHTTEENQALLNALTTLDDSELRSIFSTMTRENQDAMAELSTTLSEKPPLLSLLLEDKANQVVAAMANTDPYAITKFTYGLFTEGDINREKLLAWLDTMPDDTAGITLAIWDQLSGSNSDSKGLLADLLSSQAAGAGLTAAAYYKVSQGMTAAEFVDFLTAHATDDQIRQGVNSGSPQDAGKLLNAMDTAHRKTTIAGMTPIVLSRIAQYAHYDNVAEWLQYLPTKDSQIEFLNAIDPVILGSVIVTSMKKDSSKALIGGLLTHLEDEAFNLALSSVGIASSQKILALLYANEPIEKDGVVKHGVTTLRALFLLGPVAMADTLAEWAVQDLDTATDLLSKLMTLFSHDEDGNFNDDDALMAMDTASVVFMSIKNPAVRRDLFTQLAAVDLSAATGVLEHIVSVAPQWVKPLTNGLDTQTLPDLVRNMADDSAAIVVQSLTVAARQDVIHTLADDSAAKTASIIDAMEPTEVMATWRGDDSIATFAGSFLDTLWPSLDQATQASAYLAMKPTEQAQVTLSSELEYLADIIATSTESDRLAAENTRRLYEQQDDLSGTQQVLTVGGSVAEALAALSDLGDDINVLHVQGGLTRDDFDTDGHFLAWVKAVLTPTLSAAMAQLGRTEAEIEAMKTVVLASARAGLQAGVNDQYLGVTIDLDDQTEDGIAETKASYRFQFAASTRDASTANSGFLDNSPDISAYRLQDLATNSVNGSTLPPIIGAAGLAAPIGLLSTDHQAEVDTLRSSADVLTSITAGKDELALFDANNFFYATLGASGDDPANFSTRANQSTILSADRGFGDFATKTEAEDYYKNHVEPPLRAYLEALAFTATEIDAVLKSFIAAAKARPEGRIAMVAQKGQLLSSDWLTTSGVAADKNPLVQAQLGKANNPMVAFALVSDDFGTQADKAAEQVSAILYRASFMTGAQLDSLLSADEIVIPTVVADQLAPALMFSQEGDPATDWVNAVLWNHSRADALQTIASVLGSHEGIFWDYIGNGATAQEAHAMALSFRAGDVISALEQAILMSGVDGFEAASSDHSWTLLMILAFGRPKAREQVLADLKAEPNLDLNLGHIGNTYAVNTELYSGKVLDNVREALLVAGRRRLQVNKGNDSLIIPVEDALKAGLHNVSNITNGNVTGNIDDLQSNNKARAEGFFSTVAKGFDLLHGGLTESTTDFVHTLNSVTKALRMDSWVYAPWGSRFTFDTTPRPAGRFFTAVSESLFNGNMVIPLGERTETDDQGNEDQVVRLGFGRRFSNNLSYRGQERENVIPQGLSAILSTYFSSFTGRNINFDLNDLLHSDMRRGGVNNPYSSGYLNPGYTSTTEAYIAVDFYKSGKIRFPQLDEGLLGLDMSTYLKNEPQRDARGGSYGRNTQKLGIRAGESISTKNLTPWAFALLSPAVIALQNGFSFRGHDIGVRSLATVTTQYFFGDPANNVGYDNIRNALTFFNHFGLGLGVGALAGGEITPQLLAYTAGDIIGLTLRHFIPGDSLAVKIAAQIMSSLLANTVTALLMSIYELGGSALQVAYEKLLSVKDSIVHMIYGDFFEDNPFGGPAAPDNPNAPVEFDDESESGSDQVEIDIVEPSGDEFEMSTLFRSISNGAGNVLDEVYQAFLDVLPDSENLEGSMLTYDQLRLMFGDFQGGVTQGGPASIVSGSSILAGISVVSLDDPASLPTARDSNPFPNQEGQNDFFANTPTFFINQAAGTTYTARIANRVFAFVRQHTNNGYWASYYSPDSVAGTKIEQKTTVSLGQGFNFFGKGIYIFNYPPKADNSDSTNGTNTTSIRDNTKTANDLQQLAQIQSNLAALEINYETDLDGDGWVGNVTPGNITRALEKLEIILKAPDSDTPGVDLDGNGTIGTISDPRAAIYGLEQLLITDIDGSGSHLHTTLAKGLIAPSTRYDDSYRRANPDQDNLNSILAKEEYRLGIDLDGDGEEGIVTDTQRAVAALELVRDKDLDGDKVKGNATYTIEGQQRQVIDSMSSANGEYHLQFVPADSNSNQVQLQIVNNANEVLWQPDILLDGPGSLVVKEFGNLVILDKAGNSVWQTNTAGESYDKLSLALTENGVLKLYNPATDKVIWSSIEEQQAADWDSMLASTNITELTTFIQDMEQDKQKAEFLVELYAQQEAIAVQVLEALSADAESTASMLTAYEIEQSPYVKDRVSEVISPLSSMLQAMEHAKAGAVLTAIANTRSDVAAHLLWDMLYPDGNTETITAVSPLLLAMSSATAAATLVELDLIASYGLDLSLLSGESLGVKI